MQTAPRKRNVVLGFAVLLSIALAVSCNGFFVNPTLTGITVTPPTPSVQQGTTLQMTATGSYNDGSIKTLTGGVTWTSSDATIATASSSGIVTGVVAGTATISASSGIATGSTTVTVTFNNLVSITVSPQSISLTPGQTQKYTATGNFSSGSPQDISNQVQWTTNPSTAALIDTTGLLTAQQVTQSTTVTVTATSGTIVDSATVTINP